MSNLVQPMSSSISTAQIEVEKRLNAFATTISVPLETVKKHLQELLDINDSENTLKILDNDDYLPFGDLCFSFVDTHKLTKKAQLRLGIAHLRGNTNLQETSSITSIDTITDAVAQLIESNKPIFKLSDEELINKYDEQSSEVFKEIGSRAKGRPCIIFNKDGTTNKELSLMALAIAKKQPTDSKMMLKGSLYRVYHAGTFSEQLIDESPVFPGKALVNNYCNESGTDWTDVPHYRRVIVALHVTKVEKTITNKVLFKQLCKGAKLPDNEFKQEFAEAILLYEELERQQRLPSLKISSMQGQSKQDRAGLSA